GRCVGSATPGSHGSPMRQVARGLGRKSGPGSAGHVRQGTSDRAGQIGQVRRGRSDGAGQTGQVRQGNAHPEDGTHNWRWETEARKGSPTHCRGSPLLTRTQAGSAKPARALVRPSGTLTPRIVPATLSPGKSGMRGPLLFIASDGTVASQ